MIQNFEFDESGRHFVCCIETPSHAGMQPWWWFSVPAEGPTRYAPFEASLSDTRKSVSARIVAHYEEVLAIKARPVHPRPQWQRPAPGKPVEVQAAAAVVETAPQ